MQSRLRELARAFLQREGATCFLGYEEAPDGRTRPAFLRAVAEADRLVWDERCSANLVSYLPRFRGVDGLVGIAVKACDARGLRELVRTRQVERERLYVVGLPCTGMLDRDGAVARRCHDCRGPEGLACDETLGPMTPPELGLPPPDVDLEAMTLAERRAFWEAELERCIRCDACRRVCYGCFCPECLFEQPDPRWLSRRDSHAEKLFFHAVRALHLAGRCIGCDECLRACPTGVRLDLLNRGLAADLERCFGFAGAGVREEDPPLVTFSTDDPDPAEGS
jgi:ferredoxin